MSQTCDYGDFLDQALRDKLVCGVNHERIQSRLLTESKLTFDEACKIAKGMEITNNDIQILRNDTQVNRLGVFARSRLGPRTNDNNNKEKKPRFANYQCYTCNEFGHTSRYCYRNRDRKAKGQANRKPQNNGYQKGGKINEMEEDRATDYDDGTEFDLNLLASLDDENESDMKQLAAVADNGPEFIEVSINTVTIRMEIDSGACHSVIHISDKLKHFQEEQILPFDRRLTVVTGEVVKILGYIPVRIHKAKDPSIVFVAKLIVIDSAKKFTPLCGRTFLDLLFPGWRRWFTTTLEQSRIYAINDVTNATNFDLNKFVANIQNKFPEVFTKNASKPIKNFKVNVHLIEGAKPIFFKPYTVAYGMMDKIGNELMRLCKLEVIYPVRHSAWATPIIPVPKPQDVIRVCADCKVTINKYLKKDHYPLPRFEDLIRGLAGAQYFCVLDLRDAFQQIEIAEESQELFTVNTHMGLFRYRRLFYGISIVPTIFQSVMDEALKGLKCVVCFIDDVLIGGRTLQECIDNLLATLQ